MLLLSKNVNDKLKGRQKQIIDSRGAIKPKKKEKWIAQELQDGDWQSPKDSEDKSVTYTTEHNFQHSKLFENVTCNYCG